MSQPHLQPRTGHDALPSTQPPEAPHDRKDRAARWVSAQTAVSLLAPGDTVVIGMVEPATLTDALAAQAPRLNGLRVLTWPLLGPQTYAVPGFRCVYLSAPRGRDMSNYLPVRLADTHTIMLDGTLTPTVVFVHVSPPDSTGWCSFGLSADFTYDLARFGDVVVVAEVNQRMPRVRGAALIHVSQCDYLVRSDVPLPEMPDGGSGPAERAIGELVAAAIPERATLQVGIGKLPGAIARALSSRRGLGIQSGVISDEVMNLHRQGVVDGRHKTLHDGLIVTASVFGSRKLYTWVDDNPDVWLMPMSWVHDPVVLRSDPAFTTVNTALQVDLTGQVNAESVDGIQIGNAGGLASFHRAAVTARRGRAIVALKSLARSGASTIVPTLNRGDPVTNLRADADIYVTEFGSASLRGRTLAERAAMMVELAHPDHRESFITDAATHQLLNHASTPT